MTRGERDALLAEKLDRLEAPELTPSFYDQLHARLAEEHGVVSRKHPRFVGWTHRAQRSRGRWALRLGAAAAVVAVAAAGAWELVDSFDGSPSGALISERAHAAITEQTGILHYIVASWSPESYSFSEYWVALQGHPTYRAVQTTRSGRLFGQIRYGEGGMRVARYDAEGKPIVQPQPTGDVVEGESPGRVPRPREAASAPLQAYRDLVKAGNVKSVTETVAYGRPAYRLVVDVRSGRPMDKTTTTYVVDRETYLPIEYTIRTETRVPGLTLVTHERFLTFEILTETDANEALLNWDSNPSALSREGPLPPPPG